MDPGLQLSPVQHWVLHSELQKPIDEGHEGLSSLVVSQVLPSLPHLLKKTVFVKLTAVHISTPSLQFGDPDEHKVSVILELQSAHETSLVHL